jgi:DNA-binding CsgD family transcriptional regulator
MQHRGPRAPTPKPSKTELTKSEQRVLDLLLAQPLDSNQALADALGCTVKNVEFHMSNILRKTNTASRMELIVKMLGANNQEGGAGTGRS